MSQASELIAQQFINGGVVPADLVGQDAVSKTYVDDQFAIRDEKLNTIETGAQKNQNAFSKVNNVTAKNPTDTLNVVGGVGITVSTNPTDNKVTITATGEATPGAHGSSHNHDGSDPIPELTYATEKIEELTAKTILILSPTEYGAIGDGITNDTAAFTALEAVVKGKQIDLGNKTYVVDAVPKKNRYYNGVFKVGGFTRPVVLDAPPKFHAFGGQLSKLKAALSNPLEQYTGIVFIGDSITWGRTLPENGTFDPRDGTLSDPRDIFGSPSFVNEFKRYVGSQYAFGTAPVLSNWSASPSGESTVEYTVQQILYPKDGEFTLTSSGTSVSVTEVQSGTSITGFQLQLVDGNTAGTSNQSIKFTFTGDSFTLSFGVLESDATWYDLYVDGAKIGTYSNHVGADGFIAGNDQRRTHTFSYVRNKLIEIRTNRNGETTGNRRLRIEGIIINKKIRIINQGINGSSARVYKTNALAGNTFGDGEAVGSYDNYVFCMLGTNDRITRSDTPKGTNKFKVNLKGILDVLTPITNVILMCANPVTDESTSTYNFTMQQARGVIYDLAKTNNLDMIDNYTSWQGIDISGLSSDGLHPNALGHQVIARNIIGALEMS